MNIATYQLITKGHAKAPTFKSIIWLPADKYPLPIAFYADTAEQAEKKASDWLAEDARARAALANRAAVANAAKAAKKEKAK